MPEILTWGVPGLHFSTAPVLHGYTRDDGLDFMGELDDELLQQATTGTSLTAAPPTTLDYD